MSLQALGHVQAWGDLATTQGSSRSASLPQHPPFNGDGCCPGMQNGIKFSVQDLSERKVAPRASHQLSSAVISITLMH